MKRNFIAGAWRDSAAAFPNANPSDTDDLIGEYALASPDDVEVASIAGADAAEVWAETSPQHRHDALLAVGDALAGRKDELGALLAREEGKTRPEAVAEVGRASQIFRYFAGEALRLHGDAFASIRPGIDVELRREPVGVVGIITPWNFPIAIPAWKAAPALAAGNAVILKPSEKTPASAWALSEVIAAQNLPPGAFQLVMGDGAVGAALAASSKVDAISFTGSVDAGGRVAQACAARGARVQLEMGGKNPLIILDDAELETAVSCAVNGAFFSTGQRCTASSRLIVTDRVHDRFVDALMARMSALRVGPALEAGVDIGPLVDEAQLERVLAYVAIGQQEGAQLVRGGARVRCETTGHFLEPALFVDAHNHMRICQEEIFGPVAAVIRVADFEEAIAVANDTDFGLSAGICTTSLKYARAFRRRIQSGMAMINLPTAGVDHHAPFGGRKASSLGPREQGAAALEFYTTTKTTYWGD